MDGEKRREL